MIHRHPSHHGQTDPYAGSPPDYRQPDQRAHWWESPNPEPPQVAPTPEPQTPLIEPPKAE